jgi:HSP20 family protein
MSQLMPERRSRGGAMRTWEPRSDFEQMTERMRRMLDQTFDNLAPALLSDQGVWLPDVDIEETDDAYIVEAELPGVREKDVNIEVMGNELMITGDIKERERKGILRRQTRRTGRFEFRVMLPERLDSDDIDAKLKDGVLTVRVPKSQRAQRRRIEVNNS